MPETEVDTLSKLGGLLLTYRSALERSVGLLLLLMLAVALLASPAGRRWFSRSSRGLRLALGGLFVVASLLLVWEQLSLFDDAHISLRYADNLVRGHGLVWNLGEKVEGYTNFLWTVMLAGAMAVGADGERVALFGSMLSFALELLLLFRLSRLLRGDAETPRPPWAVLFLGVNLVFTAYGSTGMETMFATLLVTAAFERGLTGHWFVAGLLATGATMAHPDHVLLYVGLGLTLLLEARHWRQLLEASLLRRALAFASPVFFLYLPYFLLRWRYYGDFMPNTYYTKSGGSAYFSQGAVYFLISAFSTGLMALLPLIVLGWVKSPSSFLRRFAIAGGVPYLLYVVKIGGDFMLARLFIAAMPFAALLAEAGFDYLLAHGRRVMAGAGVLCFAIACTPAEMIRGRNTPSGIANESNWYPVRTLYPNVVVDSPFAPKMHLAKRIADGGLSPVVAEASIGLMGYKSRLPVVDILGLTDRYVAHLPLKGRGRPGHEKFADWPYLLGRGTQLFALSIFPAQYEQRSMVEYRGGFLFLSRYDPDFVGKLRALGIRTPNPPREIDQLLAQEADLPATRLATDFKFYEVFYFSSNPDPERRQRYLEVLARKGVRLRQESKPTTSATDAP